AEERYSRAHRDAIVAGALKSAHPERRPAGTRQSSKSQSNNSQGHRRSLTLVTPCSLWRRRLVTLPATRNAVATTEAHCDDTHDYQRSQHSVFVSNHRKIVVRFVEKSVTSSWMSNARSA